jgi:hypothetical protein
MLEEIKADLGKPRSNFVQYVGALLDSGIVVSGRSEHSRGLSDFSLPASLVAGVCRYSSIEGDLRLWNKGIISSFAWVGGADRQRAMDDADTPSES